MGNLKPWRPGQSGNSKGRPKGSRNWSSIVKDLLEDESLIPRLKAKKINISNNIDTVSAREAIVVALIIKATEGDVRAAEWLRRTAYGDTPESTELPVPIMGGLSTGATITFADPEILKEK